MDVLLLNPPSPEGTRVSRGLMGGFGMRVGPALVYPPIQLAQIAAVLEVEGHQVSIHDAEARGESRAATLAHLERTSHDVVAMPCSQDAFDFELAFSREIEVRVCLFGPMAANHVEQCFAEGGAEWVVLGEPDLAVAAVIADRVAPGTASRDDAGGVQIRPGTNRVDDLDALPLPAHHLLDSRLYRYPGDPRPMTIVHTSRGCPIGCSFCAYMVNEGRTLRARSAEHVVAEVAQAVRVLGAELIVFRDPIFTLDRQRVVDLCAALQDMEGSVEWICETALRCVDEELLVQMRAAGCIGLSFGVESGNAQLQRTYAKNKIGSHEHAIEMVHVCRRLGIRSRGFFMLGFPEEDEAMRIETVDFAVRLDPDTVQFVPLMLHAGTPLYEELDGYLPVDPAMARNVRRAYRRFYARPSRLFRELRAPGELLRKTRRYLSLSS